MSRLVSQWSNYGMNKIKAPSWWAWFKRVFSSNSRRLHMEIGRLTHDLETRDEVISKLRRIVNTPIA